MQEIETIKRWQEKLRNVLDKAAAYQKSVLYMHDVSVENYCAVYQYCCEIYAQELLI